MKPKITSEELARDILFSDEVPEIYLGMAPCRSATTAQLRVFSGACVESWYQPIKTLLRYRISEVRSYFMIPNIERIFLKETVGPYTEEESTINPLEILLEAGVPTDRLKLVISIREALATACSWVEQFSFNTDSDKLMGNLVLAYNTVNQVVEQAEALGVNNVVFDNRVLEQNTDREVLDSFFDSLDLSPHSKVFSDWTESPKMGTPESGIYFADEPELYMSRDFHRKIAQSSGLSYFPKKMRQIAGTLSEDQVQQLIDGGVFDVYARLRLKSIEDLSLNIPESTELEEYFKEISDK